MLSFILVIHLIIAIVLIVLVLLQRSEGGGLGIGGSGDFMSGRAAGNVLSRLTAIFATIFFITSLSLALLSSSNQSSSIVDNIASDNLPQIDLDLDEDTNELPDLN
ncbi:MAG: preprotein translocase subunit SecG [Alphaproteobacteria bacterium]|jgi:preprotein translocase subunit SecG|tara:strand:- start:33 stop:350 length:318 start_codon:yes stop_codon:yes gene_type:complete